MNKKFIKDKRNNKSLDVYDNGMYGLLYMVTINFYDDFSAYSNITISKRIQNYVREFYHSLNVELFGKQRLPDKKLFKAPLVFFYIDTGGTRRIGARGISNLSNNPHIHAIAYFHPETIERFESLLDAGLAKKLEKSCRAVSEVHFEKTPSKQDLVDVLTYCRKYEAANGNNLQLGDGLAFTLPQYPEKLTDQIFYKSEKEEEEMKGFNDLLRRLEILERKLEQGEHLSEKRNDIIDFNYSLRLKFKSIPVELQPFIEHAQQVINERKPWKTGL